MVARVSAKKLINGSAPRGTLGASCRALRAPRSSARCANIYLFFPRYFFDLRDGLGRKGGTASDQIHRTIIRQITSEGEGNYLMTKLSNSTGPWCYITAVNATCTLSYTGRSFFSKWRLNIETFQRSSKDDFTVTASKT